jgi:predicted acetyltransferase
MALEIRILTENEIEEAFRISQYSFNAPARHDEQLFQDRFARGREFYEPDWHLGSFEDGEMTSMMCMIPNQMYINGAALDFGTVSPVASSPLHRRKGHAGQLMRHSLEVMRERGQSISGLYTPHPAFYRRYGWEIASDASSYTFKPKDLHTQVQPRQRGRFRMLKASDWQELDAVYQAYAERHNGPFRRNEAWWRHYVLETPWRPIHDIVLWQDDAGTPQGYALYQQPSQGDRDNRVIVIEMLALTGDAYLNLLVYFGRHDIHREIVIWSSPDDPLPLHFSDAERLETKRSFAVMLRVVDFDAAMFARPPARDDETCEVVLRIDDESAPWNNGTWRAGITEGKTFVERTNATAELSVSGRVLAPMFNGYLSPSTGQATGMLEATSAEALERADRVFAVRRRPYFIDQF